VAQREQEFERANLQKFKCPAIVRQRCWSFKWIGALAPHYMEWKHIVFRRYSGHFTLSLQFPADCSPKSSFYTTFLQRAQKQDFELLTSLNVNVLSLNLNVTRVSRYRLSLTMTCPPCSNFLVKPLTIHSGFAKFEPRSGLMIVRIWRIRHSSSF